ncbi:MAG: AAA domain-containing protein, partial [Caldilineaceae bacterium SB0670_bin_27]|nr:AAA domain-containing protein [Caldilineaceae bacterium SB0670_bin_27]
AVESELYAHFLGFLDRFIKEAQGHGVNLRHRLEAHVVVWLLDEEDTLPKLGSQSPDPETLQELADELILSTDFLERIYTLLNDKRQVIFQGPPGTGKTYVAQALANCLAGKKDRVTLVQFHPSYTYEDFVRGFRPTLKDGKAGFELQDGPLLRVAEKAVNDRDSRHFLIIDEVNRGNLAKVFGELYFLLEYRDKKIRMQYQQEGEDDFTLPENLYIIGTMNTADRSIALVDLPLRRRFYFVEFLPDEDPVKSVLARWLDKRAPELAWVAKVVEEANKLMEDDRHAAIGPSYFMKETLKEEDIPRIWKHSVLPYIEERLFGDDNKISRFHLKTLREKVAPQVLGVDNDNQEEEDAKNESDSVNSAAD